MNMCQDVDLLLDEFLKVKAMTGWLEYSQARGKALFLAPSFGVERGGVCESACI